jgi:hypothetical protein
VDCDAGNIVAAQLDLARMEPGPNLDAERLQRVAQGARATDRPARPVKGGQNAVAGRLGLLLVATYMLASLAFGAAAFLLGFVICMGIVTIPIGVGVMIVGCLPWVLGQLMWNTAEGSAPRRRARRVVVHRCPPCCFQ